MNENGLAAEIDKLFPADVRRLIAETARLVETERQGPPEMVVVPREYDGESALDNLKEMLLEVVAEAGVVPDAKAEPPKGKKPTVNQRMAEMFQADPALVGWPATKWATKLGCTDAAVKQSATWKLIQAARAMLRAERPTGEP